MFFGEIHFEYEGKKYKVNGAAYSSRVCYLPNDGDLIEFTGWLESNPPRPTGIKNLGRLEVFGSCYTAEEVVE